MSRGLWRGCPGRHVAAEGGAGLAVAMKAGAPLMLLPLPQLTLWMRPRLVFLFFFLALSIHT